jgi:hypothetical protein
VAIVGIIFGLFVSWVGASELLDWWRARRRLRRVPGVIVAPEEVLGQGPGIHNRSGRFRFTTAEGRVVEAVSAKYSFPGPRPGKTVTVVYDSADPQGSAEIAGTYTFKIAMTPLFIAGGAVLAIYSLTLL